MGRLRDGQVPRRRGQGSMRCILWQVAADKVVAAGVGTVEVEHLLIAETLVEELAQRVRAGAIDQLAPALLLDQRRDAAAPEVERDAVKRRVERCAAWSPALALTRASPSGWKPADRVGLVAVGGHVLGIEELAGLRGNLDHAGARPGQGVVDDDARAGGPTDLASRSRRLRSSRWTISASLRA